MNQIMVNPSRFHWCAVPCACLLLLTSKISAEDKPIDIPGVYTHLAMMNNENECGTGAVVP